MRPLPISLEQRHQEAAASAPSLGAEQPRENALRLWCVINESREKLVHAKRVVNARACVAGRAHAEFVQVVGNVVLGVERSSMKLLRIQRFRSRNDRLFEPQGVVVQVVRHFFWQLRVFTR